MVDLGLVSDFRVLEGFVLEFLFGNRNFLVDKIRDFFCVFIGFKFLLFFMVNLSFFGVFWLELVFVRWVILVEVGLLTEREIVMDFWLKFSFRFE